jgi:serine-type D-Ala-D-Ala carboxypeptidase
MLNIKYLKGVQLVFLWLLWGCCMAQSQENKQDKLIKEVTEFLEKQTAQLTIPSAVIEIKQGNHVLLKKAFGYAQIKGFDQQKLPKPEKATLEHQYDIASLTKVVGTTTAIMRLIDAQKLQVDEPVGKYIEAFNSPDKKAITIRHLLTHTAGLYEWYPLYYYCQNKAQTYEFIGKLPLKFPVGKERRYSDLGFVLLGQIIERVSGLPLNVYLAQSVFGPLKMKHTTYNPLKTNKIAATSHGNPYEKRMVTDSTLGFSIKGLDPKSWNGWRQYTLRGEVNDGNAWYANEGVSGAAGLFSTVEDLQILVDMLKNKGKVGGKTFISKKTIAMFLTKDSFENGLGWMMDPQNSFMKNGKNGTFGHTGFTGTSITVIPEYDMSIILLINRQNTGLTEKQVYFNVNPVREQIFKNVMEFCQKTN